MPQYSCPSRRAAALATRALKIPTMRYFDDFMLITPLPLAEEALLAFTELDEIFVSELESSKSDWCQILKF